MPVIVAWLGEMIATSVGEWAMTALLALGIGFGAQAVGAGVIDHTAIFADFMANSKMWAWVSWLKLDQDVTIILSAWAGRSITDGLKVHIEKLPSKVV